MTYSITSILTRWENIQKGMSLSRLIEVSKGELHSRRWLSWVGYALQRNFKFVNAFSEIYLKNIDGL